MDRPIEIENLLKACTEFRSRTRDVRELQGSIGLCISMITDLARNKLRSILLTASDELEVIQFTSGDVRARALAVVDGIERELDSAQ
jgi:hypothetical protein